MAENLEKRFRRVGVASSDASVYLSSSDDFEFSCHSCKTNGDHIEATGYCVECSAYLCGSCMIHHLRYKLFKNHVLLRLNRITSESDVKMINNERGDHLTNDGQSSKSDSELDISNMTYFKSVNVKTESDSDECTIVAIVVLSDGSLAVADTRNACVKVIDNDYDTVRDSMKLKRDPFSMTLLPNDKLVVTLDYILNILSTQPCLKLTNTIRLDGYSLDVVYFDGKLLVSLRDPLMLEILDLTGRVLEKIVPGPDVSTLCTRPRFMALSPDKKTIFISDWTYKICLSLDMKGKLIAKNKGFEHPCGIVCSPTLQCIFICDKNGFMIRKLTMDLQCDKILLNKADNLSAPFAMCFYPEKHYFIVSNLSANDRNNINIYQF